MSGREARQLRLNAFLFHAGHHVAGWRHPSAQADGGIHFEHFVRLAKAAERAKLDAVFLADGLAAAFEQGAEGKTCAGAFEPVTLLSALAAVTERIGLIATASTTYEDPYLLARKFASLDHISGGRAGWNVVTTWSPLSAPNFGLDANPNHALRYERANEFYDVVTGLWDSWDDDAFTRHKSSGIFYDPEKMHRLNHRGKFLRVEGPLNVPRPVQGYPVIVQAGSSEAGKDFAGRTAEVIFTAQQTLEGARAFYRDVKGRLAQHGRRSEQLLIMPGIFPVLGKTESEARTKFHELQELILPEVGIALLSGMVGDFDLSKYPIDGPLPEFPETNNHKSRQALVYDVARRKNFTIRDLYLWVAGARGHCQLIGSASQVADQLEEWFRNEAADGFNLMPPILPAGLDDIVEFLVPELRRRGLFRSEYQGTTLRDHLSLERPPNRFLRAHRPEQRSQVH